MKRRTLLAATGLGISTPLVGCLSTNGPSKDTATDSDENDVSSYQSGDCVEVSHQPHLGRDNEKDDTGPVQTRCYHLLHLRLVYIEDYIEWDDVDVTLVHSDDERVVGLSHLQNLLAEAVKTPPEDRLWYEFAGEDFDSVEYTDTFENIDEQDKLVETIANLSCETLPDVPSGPYIQHEGQRFAVQLETQSECEE